MIEGIISMGGPVKGAGIGKIAGLVVPQARDIAPDSYWIKTVKQYKSLYRYHFVSGFDAIIPPENQYFEENPHEIFSRFQHMDFIVGEEFKVNYTADKIKTFLKGELE